MKSELKNWPLTPYYSLFIFYLLLTILYSLFYIRYPLPAQLIPLVRKHGKRMNLDAFLGERLCLLG